MPTLVVVGHIKTTGKEAQETVVDAFKKIVEYSSSQEPGVLKYGITVPKDESDSSVVAIEEYADQDVSDAHIASPPVQALINLFTTGNVLREAPIVYQLEFLDSFTKPDVTTHRSPYIIFGSTSYKPGTISESVPYWQKVVTTSKEEKRTLMFGVCKDKEAGGKLHQIAVYENEADHSDVHMKSESVKNNIEGTKGVVQNVDVLPLRLVAGYFHK